MLRPPYAGSTRVCMREDIERHGWDIGDHTYGRPKVMETGNGTLKIGRFCSIADATIILANHNTKHVSTYPFDALRGWWPGMNDRSCHTNSSVTIGADVWVGESSIILPGSNIGHGAVIGAGAVVRGVVPPYAIVVGNPMEVMRYRFSPENIERLLATAWWDLTDDELNNVLPLLASPDVAELLDHLERLRGVNR